MRTLALHTLGSHTARNMTVRPLQTRETADRPALTYTRMSAFQTFSIGQNISSYQILMGNTRYDQFYLVKCRTWYYPVVPDTTR